MTRKVGTDNMRTRFTLAALVAAMTVLLTACGGGGSESESASDLARVKEAGVLKVGTEGTYSPFSYHDPKTNELVGYDVEVIAAVAEELGVKVEYVETPWDAIFAGLTSNRYDVVANQVTKNEERQGLYGLSDTYTVSEGVIVTRADDSSITSLEDLKGKKSAQSLTSNWAQVAKDAGAEVESVEGFTQAVTLLKQQRVDATVNDNLAVLDYQKSTGDTSIKVAAKTGDTSEQVVATRKDSDLVAADQQGPCRPQGRRDPEDHLAEVLPGRRVREAVGGARRHRPCRGGRVNEQTVAADPRLAVAAAQVHDQGDHPADRDQLRPRPGPGARRGADAAVDGAGGLGPGAGSTSRSSAARRCWSSCSSSSTACPRSGCRSTRSRRQSSPSLSTSAGMPPR